MYTLEQEGIHRARMVARWFLGDPEWGETLVRAYLDAEDPNFKEAEEEIGIFEADKLRREEWTPKEQAS